MKTFRQFITEKEGVEVVSWIHHPIHGVVSALGSQIHDTMLHNDPELERYETPTKTEHFFKPPKGHANISHDLKRLHIHAYPIHTPGYNADKHEVENHIRTVYKVPAHYQTIGHGEF